MLAQIYEFSEFVEQTGIKTTRKWVQPDFYVGFFFNQINIQHVGIWFEFWSGKYADIQDLVHQILYFFARCIVSNNEFVMQFDLIYCTIAKTF